MKTLLIGATPSSGSSLLMTLLSRRPGVLCLPETGLFCHGEFLEAGERAPQQRGLRAGVPWVNTAAKTRHSLGWQVGPSDDRRHGFRSAWAVLDAHLEPNEQRLVVEKCPENVFAFHALLAADAAAKVVVTWREVYGVCESLVARGFNMLEALLTWVAHSYEMAVLMERYGGQVLFLEYGELLRKPEKHIEAILRFVGHGGPAKSRKSPEGGGTTGARPREVYLLNIANWTLEDTSWSRRTNESVSPRVSERLLGLAFEDMLEHTVFATPDDAVVAPVTLNAFLRKIDRRCPWTAGSRGTGEGTPLDGMYQSEMTRCLASHYVPLRVRA